MEFVKREPKPKTEFDLAGKMEKWPDCFYTEREPLLRKQLLDEAVRQGLTAEDNEFRKQLFELRYPNLGKSSTGNLDIYVKTWMEMRFLSERTGGIFSRTNPKELMKVMKSIGYDLADTERKKELLYEEIHHLGLLYMTLCQEDKQYNSVIFGIGKMSEQKQSEKVAKEVVCVARVVPQKFKCEDYCSIWSQAIFRAFSEMYPDISLS